MMILPEFFSVKYLTKLFDEKISKKDTKGIDKRRPLNFAIKKEEEISIIHNRLQNNSYYFSPYLEILQSKGREKKPRILSSATIRDKITLTALKDYLQSIYENELSKDLANSVIRRIKNDIKHDKYLYYFRIDIRGFYDSINRSKLLKSLSNKVKDESIIKLINSAIQNETLPSYESKSNREKYFRKKGIPQGLPISNILAHIYLLELDFNFKGKENTKYYRFVDDILIISKRSTFFSSLKIRYKLLTLGLRINKNKTTQGKLINSFNYLGYKIDNSQITLSEYQISRFITRISSKITWLKRGFEKTESRPDWLINNDDLFIEIFINELNEKITGAISENRRYGWLFYFIEIEDLSLLYRMDAIILKLIQNIKFIEHKHIIQIKSIVKSYFDIKYNNGKKYIHNYNQYITTKDKRNFLIHRGKLNPKQAYTKGQINRAFTLYRMRRLTMLDKDTGYY